MPKQFLTKILKILPQRMPKTFPQSMQNNSSSKNSKKNVSSNNISMKKCKQGNYSLRRPPKLTIPQAVIGQRWATVNSNLYKQTCMYVCMTHIPALTPS